MSNFPTVMKADDLKSALQQSKVQETSGGGGSFLRFDWESGEWTIGKEQDDVTGEQFLVYTPSIGHGWILWSGGRPNKTMVPFTRDLPIEPEPIYKGKDKNGNDDYDYPAEARSLQGVFYDDDDKDMVTFDINSYGGRKGVDTLLASIKANALEGSDYLYPLVELSSESYKNAKRGGKLAFNPVLKVVAWCDETGEQEGSTAKVEDKSAKADEAEAEDDQPQRKRRRRSA